MDPTRFDALARSFARGGTRRRLLAVLAALPLGAGLFGLEDDEASAERARPAASAQPAAQAQAAQQPP